MRYYKIAVISFILLIFFSCDKIGLSKKTSNAKTLFSLVPGEQTKINFENVVKQNNVSLGVRFDFN